MSRRWKTGLWIVALTAILAQGYPVNRTNPPVVADLEAPEEVMTLLRTSCYDCHSNETRWPWYSYVAPVSWLVAQDVKEARSEFNLSEWGLMESKHRAALREEMWKKVEEGEMPLPVYLVIHRKARLSPEQRDRLRRWALAEPERSAE